MQKCHSPFTTLTDCHHLSCSKKSAWLARVYLFADNAFEELFRYQSLKNAECANQSPGTKWLRLGPPRSPWRRLGRPGRVTGAKPRNAGDSEKRHPKAANACQRPVAN